MARYIPWHTDSFTTTEVILMIIQADLQYRMYWKRFAQYKGSTRTYSLFTARLASDHVYKRKVDDYITSIQTDSQRQRTLEGTVNYANNNR